SGRGGRRGLRGGDGENRGGVGLDEEASETDGDGWWSDDGRRRVVQRLVGRSGDGNLKHRP
ncbi:hypothetical protein U1Q18_012180, partial [Sarracenia purpurea var. burkii]